MTVSLLRGVFDVAMSIYLDRFLNMPPQRLPEPIDGIMDHQELHTALLERMNVQQQMEESAQIVSDYAGNVGSLDGILPTLGRAMLREDSGFHSFQIVDAGFKQYRERRGTVPRRSCPDCPSSRPDVPYSRTPESGRPAISGHIVTGTRIERYCGRL